MGAIEEQVQNLHRVVANLEDRIKNLEQRNFGGGGPKLSDEVRMILIGPPGAGTQSRMFFECLPLLTRARPL
jgi:adenylate kinase